MSHNIAFRCVKLFPLLVFVATTSSLAEDSVTTVLPTERMMVAVNRFRVTHGRNVLVHSDELSEAARSHADWIAGSRIYSHAGPNGEKTEDRVKDTGYTACAITEVLHMGSGLQDSVVSRWRDLEAMPTNPGRFWNQDTVDSLLMSGMTDFGSAGVLTSRDERVWVAILATPCEAGD